MAVTSAASGTQSASVGTEHTLYDVMEAGTYTIHVDTSDLAATDVVEFRVYQKILSGGSLRVAYVARYSGVQPTDDVIKISVPVSNDLEDEEATPTPGLRFTLKQTFGTSADFPWKVLKYA